MRPRDFSAAAHAPSPVSDRPAVFDVPVDLAALTLDFDRQIERDGDRAPVALFAKRLAIELDDLLGHGSIECGLELAVGGQGGGHLRSGEDRERGRQDAFGDRREGGRLKGLIDWSVRFLVYNWCRC